MTIDAIDVTKRFEDFVALKSVSLSVARGELLALLGPSGSGKTTLLRIISGLDFPDAGDVRIEDQSVLHVSARDRGIGFVFQHYALFRHMNVFDNVAFGLNVRPKTQRASREVIARQVNELLRLVQIERLAHRFPSELSGGQRQRVALARALAIEPKVLLLDEPFGALDTKVRKELRRWLRRLNEEMGMTSIFVTHDQEEAMEIADRLVVMSLGHIEQIGTPAEVYDSPANPFVCEFLGSVNRIIAEVKGRHVSHPAIRLGDIRVPPAAKAPSKVYVRPHDIEVRPDAKGLATVRFISTVGAIARIDVEIPGLGELIETEIAANRLHAFRLKPGVQVRLTALRGHIY
jgi:sulfate/thiosulfate transport system ATP-binding protein